MDNDSQLIWEAYTHGPKIHPKLKEYYPFAEWVSVDFLDSIKEYDRSSERGVSQFESIEDLQRDIEKHGFKEPVQITYSVNDHEILLTEGNHRLIAAKQLGYEYVPAIIQRSHYEFGNKQKVKAKGVESYDRDKYPDHIPSQFRPSWLNIRSKQI